MQDISLHILDIVENSINAGSSRIEIKVEQDYDRDLLSVEIKDNGKGMDRETIKNALNPFFTSKPGKKIGLGLPMLAQAAREGGGKLEISSEPVGGTRIRATFKLSHPDRKPLGDLDKTVYILRITHPEIDFIYYSSLN